MKPILISLLLVFSTPSFAGGEPGVCDGQQDSIYEIAEKSGTFTTLITALNLTGLDGVLKDEGNFTVFAPNDAAFAKVPKDLLQYLINNPEELKKVLLYHVAGARLTSSQVVMANEIDTLLGKMVRVDVNDQGAFLNDSKIIATDINACNGIIHVIDSVLVPNEETPGNDPKTVEYVDINSYMGTWYEIARYDNFFQKDCIAGARAQYSLQNNSVKVVNTCKTASGSKIANGIATVVDKESNAKLNVAFGPFGGGEYWILALDENYQYALVGDSSRSNLWILSRSKTLDDQTYEKLSQIAKKEGFNLSKLKKSPIYE